jgi:hypothetical protein
MSGMGNRSQQLQIRVTEAQKRAIRTAAERAGVGMSEWVLARALPAPATRLGALIGEVDGAESHAAWAEIIELLQGLGGVEFDRVLEGLDVDGLSARAANYLAALVEMKAAQIDRPPPRWTAGVVPLAMPWFGTELRRLREHLLVHAPVAFRRRNLFIDAAVGDRV